MSPVRPVLRVANALRLSADSPLTGWITQQLETCTTVHYSPQAMPNTASLTPRQNDVLSLFKERARANKPPPTYAEIAKRFRWRSRNAAKRHVLELIRKGVLNQDPRAVARGTSLAEPLEQMTPVLDSLAGNPVTHIPVPTYMLPEQGVLFVFQMPDDRMKPHAILENDLIFVGPAETPVTPRFLVVSEKGVPVVVTEAAAHRKKVLGVVVGVMRSPAALASLR